MKLFECQNCGQPVYFENTSCESCGLRLGYLPTRETISALQEARGAWRALAQPGVRYRYCANAEHDACNWLVEADRQDRFCLACRHNRLIPDLSIPENLVRWRKIELAKHWLFYTLIKLRLPLATKAEDPNGGLAFEFVAEQPVADGQTAPPPVMTGHANGVITLKLTEADDPERERQRDAMHEPYRTLLGHFRHEIAHYYWNRLIANSTKLEDFRALFGDERRDYAAALQQHYAAPAPDWQQRFVSAYASAHPWEDFAETWAHYFHVVDTLETAAAFGLTVRPRIPKSMKLASNIDFDPHDADIERIIAAWLPVTFAVNAINRSMGQPDLYPFILAPPVIDKLAFVHALIHAQRPRAEQAGVKRSLFGGLRRLVGQPS